METNGLLKKTGFITKKERDGDDVYESNHAQVVVEIPLDELSSEDLSFLAHNQNQAIEIEFSPTYRASTRRTRREDPNQLTIEDAERENERIAKVRRVLYFAIEGMPEVPADISVEQLSIALCDWFRTRKCSFEVDEMLYCVGTGDSGMCPQIFTTTEDGLRPALVIEGADLIDHVRWILNDKPAEEPEMIWKEVILSAADSDYLDAQGCRYYVTAAPVDAGEEASFYVAHVDANGDDAGAVLAATIFENVPDHPLSREEAQIALSAWALKNEYAAVAPEGYGNVYLAKNGSYWRVCWLPEEQEGYGYCFRGCSWDGDGEQIWTPIEELSNCSTWEEAQADLDAFIAEEDGTDAVSVQAYIKFIEAVAETDGELIPEEEIEAAENLDEDTLLEATAHVVADPDPLSEEETQAA